ncbi:MAG: glutathione S-transferase [Nannocystaceae bacterium]|nr:glutathione S-transferase [Nannocystaceae bacterium]
MLVHHLEKSRSHRLLWMLEELELAYEMKTYERDPVTIRAPDSLKKVHPLGKAPVLEVDGKRYAESGAILEHCAEVLGEGRFRPEPRTADFDQYRYWMHYAEGSVMPPLLVRLLMSKVANAPLPFFIKPVAKGIVKKIEGAFTAPELERHAAFIEQHLGEHKFFAGESFTAADVQMSYPVEALLARGRVEANQDKTRAWFETASARPAYKRAAEKGGPVLL